MHELDALFKTETAPVQGEPFPHIVVDDYFRADFFHDLKEQFPQIPANDRPKNWARSLYWGDSTYEETLSARPAWQQLFDAVHSQAFVDYVLRQFKDLWHSEGCTISLEDARFISFCETRKDKEQKHLTEGEHEPHEIWSRLDLYQAWPGYRRTAHLDHRRRLISMLVYFDDQKEIKMSGGELTLHTSSLDLELLERLGAYQAPWALSEARSLWSKFSNVSNTGCPTLWRLTPEHCKSIPRRKGARVVTTLN